MSNNPGQSSQNVPGIQKQNIAWLKAQTELMKAQTEYQKALSKIKKEDMDAMTESIGAFERFSTAGGFNLIFGGSIDRLKTNITNDFEGALAPITNSLGGLVNTLFSALTDETTGLGKGFNFVTSAITNTINFAAKGWESLLSGQNLFAAEVDKFTAEQLAHIAKYADQSVAAGYFDLNATDIANLQAALARGLDFSF